MTAIHQDPCVESVVADFLSWQNNERKQGTTVDTINLRDQGGSLQRSKGFLLIKGDRNAYEAPPEPVDSKMTTQWQPIASNSGGSMDPLIKLR